MDLKRIISRNLMNELSKQDLTVSSLSKLCGVSQPTVWRYVRGKGNPQMENLKKVTDALNLELSDILKGEASDD